MDKNIKNLTGGLAIFTAIATIILILFIMPWFSFWIAYFCGWIAKLVIGKYLVEGFSLFGIIIPINKIPLIAGILGWIGSFFKSTTRMTDTHNKN